MLRFICQPLKHVGSNPGNCLKIVFGIYEKFSEISESKTPETVDAIGIQPTASILF